MNNNPNQKSTPKNLVLIGGTGAAVIGKVAKKNPNWLVSLLVSLVDDGGSTGRLSKTLNIPPVGDIRKALAALSTWSPKAITHFEARFLDGELKCHPWGNLFLAGLLLQNKDINQTLKKAQKILKTKGQVITTTKEPTKLNTRFKNGKVIKGENNLDENKITSFGPPVEYFLTTPTPKANPKATQALKKADWIVLGPGDLGANTIAPILTPGIASAIRQSKAKIVYIANLMTKLGETDQLTLSDCLRLIEKTLQRKIDYLLLNQAPLPQKALSRYHKQGEVPFPLDFSLLKKESYQVFLADLLNPQPQEKSTADKLRRSLLRHSGEKTVRLLDKIIKELK